jgi:hypothetical protein
MKRYFVFAVCGASEHIDSLNYVLPFLKHFSKYEVIVVTDLLRNKGIIQHEHIININTPQELDNHQASIFLKTGLWQFLDMQHQYCYLDTDIIAINEKVDLIFEQYKSPISFCTDHCKMLAFSPSALYFILNKEHPEAAQKMKDYIKAGKLNIYVAASSVTLEQALSDFQERLAQESRAIGYPVERYLLILWLMSKHYASLPERGGQNTSRKLLLFFCKRISQVIQFALRPFCRDKWQLKENAYWVNKHGKHIWPACYHYYSFMSSYGYFWHPFYNTWYNTEGILQCEPSYGTSSMVTWNNAKGQWIDRDGNKLASSEPWGIAKLINNTFDVSIEASNWQHWNGGAFIFDADSIPFLENWHKYCLQIFSDIQWKTRDQGTLIATCWKFGLQHHPTIPIAFNFLADYYNDDLSYKGDFQFKFVKSDIEVKPYFLHVYHHFGDKNWKLWQDIEKLASTLH